MPERVFNCEIMINYIKASFQELQKVTWPKKEESLKLTLITIVFSVVCVLAIMFVDKVFNLGYQSLLDLNPSTLNSTNIDFTPSFDIESITTESNEIQILDSNAVEITE